MKNGADIIETCSYQINQSNLMKYLKIDTVEAKKFLLLTFGQCYKTSLWGNLGFQHFLA